MRMVIVLAFVLMAPIAQAQKVLSGPGFSFLDPPSVARDLRVVRGTATIENNSYLLQGSGGQNLIQRQLFDRGQFVPIAIDVTHTRNKISFANFPGVREDLNAIGAYSKRGAYMLREGGGGARSALYLDFSGKTHRQYESPLANSVSRFVGRAIDGNTGKVPRPHGVGINTIAIWRSSFGGDLYINSVNFKTNDTWTKLSESDTKEYTRYRSDNEDIDILVFKNSGTTIARNCIEGLPRCHTFIGRWQHNYDGLTNYIYAK